MGCPKRFQVLEVETRAGVEEGRAREALVERLRQVLELRNFWREVRFIGFRRCVGLSCPQAARNWMYSIQLEPELVLAAHIEFVRLIASTNYSVGGAHICIYINNNYN